MTDGTRPRVITEPLGGSPLSVALQHRRLPAELQPWWPASVDEWRDHARRTASGGWYDRIAGAIEASGPARARIDRAAKHGVVVTTGQQAGLFGGPVYTLAKALTALALADTLERETGIPVAPVFWAATDDADFDEARGTYVADADGLHHLEHVERPPAGTPMYDAPIGEVAALLAALRKSCGSAAHGEYLQLAWDAYDRPRATIGSAYVALMRGLLEPLGIAVLDVSSQAYLDAARPVLLESLQRAAAIATGIAQRTEAIRALGFDPQVTDDRGLSLVFALVNGVKRRLTLEEAATFAARHPETVLSPNVLLRPVVERELLPTVGYVAGPGELAYFVQTNAVAEALERKPLVSLPRWSTSIIEPFAQRALSRLKLAPEELRNLPALQRRLATAAVPENVATAWARLQEQLRRSIGELGDAVSHERLMPPAVIEGLERSLAHKLGRAERRLLAAAKRRDAQTQRDLGVAAAALFPLGKRQERVLNFIPMLARGGDELLTTMREAAEVHARSLVRSERVEPVAAR